MAMKNEATKHMNVSVEQDGDAWAIVVRIEGDPDVSYPVESQTQGEELIKAAIPMMMPIIQSAIERGEYVSLIANQGAQE